MATIAAEVDWEETRRMVYRQCWTFSRRYGVDWEDCLEVAQMAWAKARQSYDPAKGTKLSSWVWFSVSTALKDIPRDASRDRLRTNCEAVGGGHEGEGDDKTRWDESVPDRPRGLLSRLLSELSEDARVVIRCVCEVPADLMPRGKRQVERYRKGIRKRLAGQGWTPGRIMAACDEVEEALTE